MRYLVQLLAQFLAVIIVVSFHEFAHAYAAYKCGDPTAKFSGRMSLNPAKHFDAFGMVSFALMGFGWAKPVPINPNNFNDYKKGCLWTSAAGVLMNYVMAFVFYPVLILTNAYVLPIFAGKYLYVALSAFTYALFVYSLNFCIFNLLPIYPLDGFRILEASNNRKGKAYWFLRQNGYYILLGLIFISFFADRIPVLGYFNILGYVMNFAIDVFGKPITLFWNWILGFIL